MKFSFRKFVRQVRETHELLHETLIGFVIRVILALTILWSLYTFIDAYLRYSDNHRPAYLEQRDYDHIKVRGLTCHYIEVEQIVRKVGQPMILVAKDKTYWTYDKTTRGSGYYVTESTGRLVGTARDQCPPEEDLKPKPFTLKDVSLFIRTSFKFGFIGWTVTVGGTLVVIGLDVLTLLWEQLWEEE